MIYQSHPSNSLEILPWKMKIALSLRELTIWMTSRLMHSVEMIHYLNRYKSQSRNLQPG
jgi:hypothetical protein